MHKLWLFNHTSGTKPAKPKARVADVVIWPTASQPWERIQQKGCGAPTGATSGYSWNDARGDAPG